MKHTINLMLAVILLCGLTISSCKKNSNDDTNPTNPAHPTRTMLVGMECSDEYFKTTYTYEYDDNYRIVRSEEYEEYISDLNSNQGGVLKEYNFSYSEGHISINGFEYGGEISYECTLDDEGRIIHIDKTGIDNYHVDFTYGYNGFLLKRGTDNYIWEAGNLKYIKKQGGEAQFETSYASSQAMPSLIGYGDIPELCAQGCFGTLPFNLPSKITYYSSTPGPPYVVNISYNVDANGHVSSFMKNGEIYTCHWEDI